MSRNNKTVDRIQGIWNMIGGDNVVDAIYGGRARIVVEWVESKLKNFDASAWSAFYKKHFNLDADFSGLKIPPKPADGKWRLLVILKGITNNLAYDACYRAFGGKCSRYTEDLDKGVPTNERDPNRDGTYAIWVRDDQKADKVHKNKSANMVKDAGLKTETLLERMIHELVYFSETGNHLDVKNITLCSGSRYSDGGVPCAGWDDGKFGVDWDDADFRDDGLRPREVVTL